MRWRKTFLVEVAEGLQRLGLTGCPVCKSETIGANRYPLMGLVGGLPTKISNEEDPEVHTDYFVRVECEVCGHVLLFNAERFRTGDEVILIKGLTMEEEEEVDRRDPL